MRQRISRKGLRALISEEGVRRYAYNDPAGYATFGVGHLLHRSPVTLADQIKWGTPRLPRPMWFVKRVLRRDLKAFDAAVRQAAGTRLRPHEFDALVSLAFNIGVGGFKSSTVARELHKGRGHGNYRRAADAILMWDNPSMLRPRRERERTMFLTGRYERL